MWRSAPRSKGRYEVVVRLNAGLGGAATSSANPKSVVQRVSARRSLGATPRLTRAGLARGLKSVFVPGTAGAGDRVGKQQAGHGGSLMEAMGLKPMVRRR